MGNFLFSFFILIYLFIYLFILIGSDGPPLTSIFRIVAGCKKFFLQRFSCILTKFLEKCATKKVLQKHSAKVDLKVLGKSYGEIDEDLMKFVL